MKVNISFFLFQYVVLLTQFVLISGRTMIGTNIRQAQSGEYNYVVSVMKKLRRNPAGEHFCTGVLVTRKDVLTAAHCLEDESVNRTQVLVGTVDLRSGQVFFICWWQTYDQWAVANNVHLAPDTKNDVANIRLLKKVPNHILPARLSRLQKSELFNAEVVIAGWGINAEGIMPDIMRLGTVQIIENNVCENKLERIIGSQVVVEEQIMCTFVSPYVLLQAGDSGSPLLFRNRLVAINHGTCPINHPEYSERVNLHFTIAFYRAFINSMKENS